MRLYLSSFRLGACPGRLMALTRGGRAAAVIANALDAYPSDTRSDGVARELVALGELGFDPEELDLRSYFDADGILERLQRYDLVWVRGGDVWTLRHSMARSGADAAITRLVASDEIVYGGYSAGVCVLAPTLRGLEAVDDPALVKTLYGVGPGWDGLCVIDLCIVPHVDSPDHPESAACDGVAEAYRQSNVPHRCLRDGDVLLRDGDVEEMCTA